MVFSKTKSKEDKILNFPPFGKLNLQNDGREWVGVVSGIVPSNLVEISIETEVNDEYLDRKIVKLEDFIQKLLKQLDELFDHVHAQFSGSKWDSTPSQLKQMYFLTAVSIKADCATFWVVLEPEIAVDSIFNHLLRFTVIGDEITWFNFAE